MLISKVTNNKLYEDIEKLSTKVPQCSMHIKGSMDGFGNSKTEYVFYVLQNE